MSIGLGHGFVVGGQRAFQIQRHDAGLGRAEFADLGVHALELAHGAAEQDDFGAGRRQRQRHGAADARARAGDHDDAASNSSGCG